MSGIHKKCYYLYGFVSVCKTIIIINGLINLKLIIKLKIAGTIKSYQHKSILTLAIARVNIDLTVSIAGLL